MNWLDRSLNNHRLLTAKLVIGFCSFFFALNALAKPELNNATGATVTQTPNSTVVNQTSQKAILNWNSFNIGPNESTHFQQPAGGVALNRISPSQGASSIYGRLTATGQIILMNPAGFFFGPNAYVSVGGLIATTHNLTDANFLNGIYKFSNVSGYPDASIINEGTIIAAQHGLIALVAPNVINHGLIQADVGSVVLASGSAFTINFDNNTLLSFKVDEKTLNSGNITNTGMLSADGGKIIVTAKAAQNVLDNVINMNGIAQARSVDQVNGEIILGGDNEGGVVTVAGNLDASGNHPGETGGNITITGYNIVVNEPSIIDVSGDVGGGNIHIGGNYLGQGPLPTATNTIVMPNTLLLADAKSYGNGGNIIVWSDNFTKAQGNISARGGAQGGDGGFVETSSHKYLNSTGIHVDVRAPFGKTGTWLLDPYNLTISTGATNNVDVDLFCTTCNYVAIDTGANVNTTDLVTNLATANVILSTGTLGAEAGDISVLNAFTWTSSNFLTLNAANNIIINANITGTSGTLNLSAPGGTITQNAAAVLNVGTLNINDGNLQLNAANAINAATAVILANTAGVGITLNNFSQTIGSLAGGGTTGGNVSLGSATLTLGNTTNTTYNGVISGTGGVTKQGTGIFTIGGSNTYTGQTTLNAGTIRLGASDVISDTSNLLMANGQTTTFDLNNFNETVGFLANGGGGNTLSLGSGTLTINNGISTTYRGVITGTGGIIKQGTGFLAIGGTQTYTGTTTINAGEIRMIDNNNVLNANTSVVLSNTSGALLGLNGFNLTIASLSGGGTTGGNVSLGSATLTFGNTTDTTFAGAISGTGGFIKQGTSNVILSGNNSFSGAAAINAGTLTASHANALGSTAGATTVASGATLNINGVTIGAEPLTISGTGVGGAGVVTSTGTASLSGAITLAADSTIGGTGTLTLSGIISGGQALTKIGSSTLNLNGANTYTGLTNINVGTVSVGNATGLGTTAAGTIVANGATLNINGATVGAEALTISGTGVSGNGALTSTGTSTFGGTIALAADTSIGGSGTFTLSNTISGAQALTKIGSSTLNLNGNNNYSGLTNINVGTISVGNATGLGTTAAGTIVASGATLDINGVAVGTESLTLSGTGASSNGALTGTGTGSFAGNIALAADSTFGGTGTLTLSGIISGGQAVTKVGNGLINFSGANNYSGTTSINAGTLRISNATGLGTTAGGTTVASGATLALNAVDIGTEAVTLNGGTLDTTGAAIMSGALTLGSSTSSIINMNGGSTYTLNNDINGNGTLTLQGAGSYLVNGSIGNVTPVVAVNSNAAGTITGSVTTSGSQSYSAITLGANTTYTSTGGSIAFDTIDGGFDLIVNSANNVTFGGAVGGTPLTSLTVNAANININGGSISTVGDQIYTGTLTLGGTTTLATTGTGNTNITINGGILGNQNLNLSNAAGSNGNFTLGSTMTVNDVNVTGGAGGSNTLNVNSGSTQSWNITGTNTGNITGITNVGGTFAFNNIQNLSGGADNDSFTLNGGTLSGSINGGGGTNNTVIADNVSNTWNITGTNTGNVTGVNSFSNIQNLTGGNSGNNFIFADNAIIDGTVNGGSLSATNTLNYTAYTSPITITLTATDIGSTATGSTRINGFSNITNVDVNNSLTNTLVLPNKFNSLVITDALTGYLNDPLFFSGFNTFNSGSGTGSITITASYIVFNGVVYVNGVPMYFNNFNFTFPTQVINVSQIIQQPESNADDSTTTAKTTWLIAGESVMQNISDMAKDVSKYYDQDLNKIKINPYCTATS